MTPSRPPTKRASPLRPCGLRECRSRAPERYDTTPPGASQARRVTGAPPHSQDSDPTCCDPRVHVKRVSVSFGATPLGRRPRRTKSVGTAAPAATARRARPMPSLRQRSESPMTSRRASRASVEHTFVPEATSTGSATIPITCWTSNDARASSLLASRRPRAASASVPSSRSVVPRDRASHAATSIADQSCSTPPNGVTTGPEPAAAAASEPDVAGRADSGARRGPGRAGRCSSSRRRVDQHELGVVSCGGQPASLPGSAAV